VGLHVDVALMWLDCMDMLFDKK